jgi:V8-like Glu-specific endopeptidase
MVQLETADFQWLVNLLRGNDLMQTGDSRRAALKMAGLERLAPQLQLEGPAFVVTSNMISFLANFGRLSYEQEALGVFLNTVKGSGYVGLEEQNQLAKMINQYNMMEPIAPSKAVSEWKNPTTASTVVEKVFGENTLRPIAFLSRGLEVSRSVMYIGVTAGGERWSGTGFLVAPGLGMTNHHVISVAEQLSGTTTKFNYQETFDGRDEPTRVYKAKAGGQFHANEELDYAVFEVEEEPGKEWGYLALKPRDVKRGERINIVQHPYGQPKQISIQNNMVEYVDENVLQYVTSTNPGSSGSPVFNDQWQVVGLHHAGGNIPEPTTGRYYGRNEGMLMSKILGDLPAGIREQIDEAAQASE